MIIKVIGTANDARNVSENMKVWMGIGKVLAAGIVAVAILSLLLCFYSLTPLHRENKAGNTDYVWEANSLYVNMTEGISFGRFDALGYNNRTVIADPDIILLGSSHMEAANVMPDENIGAILNRELDGKYSAYNLGISGHTLVKVCRYLPANLKLYDTAPRITVIETDSVRLTTTDVDSVFDGSVDYTKSYDTGILGILQRIPFLRQLYRQTVGGLWDLLTPPRQTAAADSGETESVKEVVPSADYDACDRLLRYLSSLEKEYKTQIIIFYHPQEKLMPDGTITYRFGEAAAVFARAAAGNGITFVDMTEPFHKMYTEEHHVAHGFATGEIGVGHLNAYGHEAVAEALLPVILESMEDAEICK